MAVTANKDKYYATTLRLPKRVYESAKQALKRGNSEAGSFNDFVVDAIKERLRNLREQEIDAAIAEIANDADYQESSIRMTREFAWSDWDAFRTEPESAGRREARLAPTTKARQRRRL